MTLSNTNLQTNTIPESDFLKKPDDPLNNSRENFTQNSISFTQYIPYLFLLILFIKSISKHENNFSTCYLIIFSIIINNVIKPLNQQSPITVIAYLLQIIPQDRMMFFTILLFYLSAIFQIFRLTRTKFYPKLRKIRIWCGPIYGCLLFWRILYKIRGVQIHSIALVIFLIGVKFRPDFSEGEHIYFVNRRKHKFCMIINFFMIFICDIWSLCLYYISI